MIPQRVCFRYLVCPWVFANSVHKALKDGLAWQCRLPTALELDARGAQRRCDGRLDAVVKSARMVALRGRDGLGVITKGARLELRALRTVTNVVID